MPEQNVEIARRAVERFNEQFNAEDIDLDLFAADVMWDNSNAAFDGAVYRGHDGMREWISLLRAMWQRQEIEAQEFIPVGEDQVIVPIRIVSVGRDDVETVANAAIHMTLREGKVTLLKAFQSRADALEAVR